MALGTRLRASPEAGITVSMCSSTTTPRICKDNAKYTSRALSGLKPTPIRVRTSDSRFWMLACSASLLSSLVRIRMSSTSTGRSRNASRIRWVWLRSASCQVSSPTKGAAK
ncbi:Uncharacterised protein [Mycobacteroides abscessus subsp. abscessus]|nr:Uncharacterised protein [Mycobacteroides abscessus subsp. abscessus]